jgi:PKD repeat protein
LPPTPGAPAKPYVAPQFAPQANFISSVLSNLNVQFTNTSTGTATSYDWDFGDGTPHSGIANPVHQYASAGIYHVTLTASNSAVSKFGSTQFEKTVIVTNITPQVSFSTTISGLAVQVQNTSTVASTPPAWDFGDGVGTGSGQNFVYIYSSPGTYTIKMTAGGTVVTNTVTVSAPTGGFNPIFWTEFYNSQEFTANGVTNNLEDIITGVASSNNASAKSSQLISSAGNGFGIIGAIYPCSAIGNGVYFGLATSDPARTPSAFNYCFYVQEQIHGLVNVYIYESGSLVYTWASTYNPSTEYLSITINGSGQVVYSTGTINFDGGGNFLSYGSPSVLYTSLVAPTFPMMAAAILSNGIYSPGTISYPQINNSATGSQLAGLPEPSFTYALDGANYLLTHFYGASTNSPTGWLWDFGDGIGTSTLQSPSYTYVTEGIYQVKLTVTNALGNNFVIQGVAVIPPTTGTPSDVEKGDVAYYEIDHPNSRVLMYSLAEIYLGFFGGYGSLPGQLNNPTKLAVNTVFQEF